MRAITLVLMLAVISPPVGARANVTYEFDIMTAFAASNPFPDQIGNAAFNGNTGYLQIANSGPSAYSGIIRIVANSAFDGDLTFSINNAFISSGGSVSIGMPVNSSAAGGFNNFTGSSARSIPGTFRPGIILFMDGGVTGNGSSGSIKIAVQDLDIKTGTILTDPNGFQTGSFVMQGGDPFGLFNGDAFALAQPNGHFTFANNATPEPAARLVLAIPLAALLLARYRRRRGPPLPRPGQTRGC
jgi:hypothetical protein